MRRIMAARVWRRLRASASIAAACLRFAVAVPLAAVMLGEPVLASMVAGAALVTGGVTMANPGKP